MGELAPKKYWILGKEVMTDPPYQRICTPAYAAAVEGLATPGMLVLMLAAIIVGAAIGAWLGSPLWKRGQARIHIRKA